MKKLIRTIFVLAAITVLSPIFTQSAFADICVPTDPDFDAVDCAANGGVVGTPIGIGGGPGGGGNVPIDGGLSLMLAASGAAGAHKIWKNRKQKTENKEA
jgi:hypothetical protein